MNLDGLIWHCLREFPEGEVLVGGSNVKDYDIETLRNAV